VFGQYDIEDIALSGGDVFTGSIYDPGEIAASWVSEWAAQEVPTDIYSAYYNPVTGQMETPIGTSASAQPIATTPPSGGGGIIQSVLGAGASIAAAILGGRTATSPTATSATPYYNAATGKYQATPVTTTGVTSITSLLSSLTSSLPLLAIVGGGAYFLLRKKKGRK
jgi:hypothetical protein